MRRIERKRYASRKSDKIHQHTINYRENQYQKNTQNAVCHEISGQNQCSMGIVPGAPTSEAHQALSSSDGSNCWIKQNGGALPRDKNTGKMMETVGKSWKTMKRGNWRVMEQHSINYLILIWGSWPLEPHSLSGHLVGFMEGGVHPNSLRESQDIWANGTATSAAASSWVIIESGNWFETLYSLEDMYVYVSTDNEWRYIYNDLPISVLTHRTGWFRAFGCPLSDFREDSKRPFLGIQTTTTGRVFVTNVAGFLGIVEWLCWDENLKE